MATNSVVFAICTGDHGHSIPADNAFDSTFDFSVAGIGRLSIYRNRVDIRRVGGKRDVYVERILGLIFKSAQQVPDSLRAVFL